MKKTLLAILLFSTLSLLGCSCTYHSQVVGNGDTIEKTFSVSEFSVVDASHAFDIKVSVGKETSVRIETDENIMEYVKISVDNNTLYLSTKSNKNIRGSIKAFITTPSLNGANLSGACKIEVEGIETSKFSIDMSGACKGTFSGNTEKLDVNLSGATKINTVDLKATDVIVDVSGASKCDIYSSSSINADASGASKIVIYGDPPNVKTDVSGASKITSNWFWNCDINQLTLFTKSNLIGNKMIDKPKIGIIMGSDSDLPIMEKAFAVCKEFNVPFEVKIISAHRTPDVHAEYSKSAASRGIKIIIAAAGMAAHLPGVTAGHTHLPVIGVPISSKNLDGMDALMAIVQMPPGIPVATVAIDGAKNAALLAIQILAVSDLELSEKFIQFKKDMAEASVKKNDGLKY